MAGRPDSAFEELKNNMRWEAHKMVASSFRILLGLAVLFSWDSFIQEQRKKYGLEGPPKEVLDTLSTKYEDYQQIKNLINRDLQAGQVPRFVIVDSAGKEIFRG